MHRHGHAEPTPTGRVARRADRDAGMLRIIDRTVLLLGTGFLGLVLATPLSGLAQARLWFSVEIVTALRTSLAIAIPAALLATGMALAIAVSARRADGLKARMLGSLPLAVLAMPPFALIAGLYLPVRRVLPPESAALVLVPLVNALMALPFTYRLIEPQARAAHRRFARLADHLGLAGWRRITIVDWPMLKSAILASLALAAAFSFGDFGVAALFAGAEFGTLPLLLQERMAAYRMAEAEAIAALILLTSLVLAYASLWHADAQGN
jgi:thiamine transport system permease protein